MSDLEILPVTTWRQRRQFLHLPWQLHRDDPNWIPPLRTNQKELVGDKRHPFYQQAEAQTFLAYRGKEPVGRVAAILNHAHNERHKERRGFFGFFESVDDQAVADGLLGAVHEWFAERDVHLLRGPMNPSMNYECGMLIDGFDSPPTFMMTYNPSFYPRLVEGFGFTKSQDTYAFWGHVDMMEGLDKKLDFVVEECTRRFELKLRPMDTSRFLQEVRMFLELYNRAMVGTWGFVPMSEAEIRHMARSLKPLIVPMLTTVAEVDGKPIGATFNLLDYNPRIKRIDGRLFPFGFLRLIMNKQQIHRTRLIATAVVPEYQAWGVGLVLLSHLVPDALAWGITEAEFSWVLESNHLSRKSLERGGAKLIKTFRIYDYE